MANTVLEVALVSDATRFSQGFRKAEGTVNSFSKQVDKASNNSLAKLDSRVKNIGVSFASLGVAFGAAQVVSFAKDSIRAFSELEQAVGGVESVFGSAADEILKVGKNAASTAGLSEAAFSTAATRIGGMLQNLGLGVDETVVKTKELIQIGADLAATYGGTVQEAVDAIAAALRGETDPIERYAVSVKQADVNARALALGLTKSTTSVDKHSKAVATLDLIYEQTAKAQGQFARELDTVAGKTAVAGAKFEDLKAQIGEELAPTVVEATSQVSNLFDALDEDVNLGWSQRLSAAIQTLLGESAESVEAYIEQKDAANDAADAVDDLTSQTAALSAGMDRARHSTKAQEEAFEEQGEAVDKLTQKQRTYLESLQAAINPVFGAVQALGSLREAQAHYEELQESGEASAEELAEAQLAVVESLLRAQAALDQVDPTGLTNSIRFLAEELNLTEEEVQALLNTLGVLDGKTVTTTVITNFIERRDVQSGTGRTVRGGRARGGRVTAGETYEVGERGRELFVPDSNGRIIPHGQYGGGNSLNLTIHNPEPRAATADFQRELLLAGVARWAEVN